MQALALLWFFGVILGSNMNGPNLIGLSGALIAGYAYLPQITHLIKERCSAGISRTAFALWLLSSILVTTNAIYIHAPVFIILGFVQIVATGIIFIFSTKYDGQVCEYHILATNTKAVLQEGKRIVSK